MKSRLMMPQEIEVFYILPAIRRDMAISMKASGRKQKDIAKLLCVEESTISQYIKDKRAAKIRLEEGFRNDVAKAAERISSQADFIKEAQRLLAIMRKRTFCSGFKR